MKALSIIRKTVVGTAVLAMALSLGCGKDKGGGAVATVGTQGCGGNPGSCTVGSSYGLGVLLTTATGQGVMYGYNNYNYNGFNNNNYNNGTIQVQANMGFYAVNSANIQNLANYQQQINNNSYSGMLPYSGALNVDGVIRLSNSYNGGQNNGTCQLDSGDYYITVLQQGEWQSYNNGWSGSNSAQFGNLKVRATNTSTARYMDILIQYGEVMSTSNGFYTNGVNTNSSSMTANAIVETINGQNCGQMQMEIQGSYYNGNNPGNDPYANDPYYYLIPQGYNQQNCGTALWGLVEYCY